MYKVARVTPQPTGVAGWVAIEKPDPRGGPSFSQSYEVDRPVAMWIPLLALLSLALDGASACYDFCPYSPEAGSTPRVPLYQGVVVGTASVSTSGRLFYSFRGVPYAQPPIGELRFRAPLPVEAGVDEIDATRDAPSCTQKNYLLPVPFLSGQEDCLFLNVYTPWLLTIGGEDRLLPVMVYIHGGGWFTGSGDSVINGPERLLDRNIVLVTLNYRLGALGFLSTGDENAPGNYALKDQVEALHWVQFNIAAFGGDPNSVTIFGQSAGSVSVHYHILSPMSRGLFHRAISQSGTALGAWAWPADALPVARRQAQLVGCPDSDSAAMVECLRSVDALQLTDSGDNFHFWSIDPLTTFVPTVEAEGPTAFIVEDPMTSIQNGRFSRVPWMIGTVASEGIIRALPIVSTPELLDDLNANWTTLGPKLFEMEKSVAPESIDEVWANVTRFYLNDQLPLLPDKAQGFVDIFNLGTYFDLALQMYSDRSFIHGTHKSALLHVAQGHDTIYMYHLDYRGFYTYADLFATNPVYYGTSHCDDLIYLFRAPVLFPDWPVDHPDRVLSDVLVTLWTNFATYSVPSPTDSGRFGISCDLSIGCDLSRLVWTPIPVDSMSPRTEFLGIRQRNNHTLDLTMEVDLLRERMAFWDDAPLAENTGDGLPHRNNLRV